jgi:predicted Holliday junction resolvase-like endonuclease
MLLETILVVTGASGISYWIARRFAKLNEDNLLEKHERDTQLLIDGYDAEIIQVEKEGKIKAAKALKRSKEVRIGLAEENMLIYNENFKYDGGDFRALGSPIDGMIFPGAVQDDITEIVLLECKTGNSKLSKKQRQIRDLVEAGKVRFEEFRIKTKPVKLSHKDDLVVDYGCLCDECVSK